MIVTVAETIVGIVIGLILTGFAFALIMYALTS